jgi:penicillin-binding protein 1A
MFSSTRKRILAQILLLLTVVGTVGIGIATGFAAAKMVDADIREELEEYDPALPTQIYDRDGELITEIFSEVKRDIVPVHKLPRHLIYALLSREDSSFFDHHGFSIRGTTRAAINVLMGTYFSGGSTLTQQVAGTHFADRSELTITRKLKELWHAFQMERELSKYEILELYMNEMYFGHNTYGVEAASQFYFNHSAREITIAEAAVLVIQLASPARYSPINHPERARARQKDVLQHMVDLGYATQQEADLSFQRYWENYNYQRSNIASAYFDNESKAPYFSEYVRLQLNDMLYGAVNINKDGYIVHTTLDLDYQRIAQSVMDKHFRRINQRYTQNKRERFDVVEKTYLPIIDLLALSFDMNEIRVSGAKEKRQAKNVYYRSIGPTVEMLAGMFGSPSLSSLAQYTNKQTEEIQQTETIEGALITLDNHTGHILSMIGGSDFETKQYNRAVDAKVQPGSSFKPLYYSEAISSGQYTPATRLYDGPIVFFDDSGKKYTPMNYLGHWQGSVLLRTALANSMNVPSLQVLDGIGFDRAVQRASNLLGMEEQSDDRTLFPRAFPLGLGVTSVAPIKMAKAFATFPNQGKAVDPLAITKVLNRSGDVIINPEQERLQQEKLKNKGQERVLSPQAAYVMVDLLKSTVDFGTLRWRRVNVGGFDDMPMAGKTGTTQNWGDAWTVGFSPYYTTAIWFGFDSGGNSLGRELTGATAAGPAWAEYMKKIHQGLPRQKFERPENGLVELQVCTESGKLPTQHCPNTKEELFIAGTEPDKFCDIHEFKRKRDEELVRKLQESMMYEDFDIDTSDLPSLEESIESEMDSLESEEELDLSTEELGDTDSGGQDEQTETEDEDEGGGNPYVD